MNEWTTEIIWSFPGEEYGLFASLATFISYYFTLRKLPTKYKIILSVIRFLVVVLFIFCLANPKIIKKEKIPPHTKQKIAVLMDTSASMFKKGFWDKVRFDDAKKYFNENINITKNKYDFNLFSFNKTIQSVNDFENILSDKTTTKTHLFDSIQSFINNPENKKFKGIITLTDGIDTSGKSPNDLLYDLEMSTSEFAYIPITTSIYSPPLICFEKIESEAISRVGTQSSVTVLFKSSNLSRNQSFKFIVKKDDKIFYKKDFIAKDENSSLHVVNFNIPIKEEGNQIFTAEVISINKKLASSSWNVKGVNNKKINVLLYQGRLDWGTRYLCGVFDKDKNISFDINFAEKSFGLGFKEETMIVKFPPVKNYYKYDVIIMLNLKKSQITKDLEKKLADYLNKGGSILFIVANSEVAKEFASSHIEQLLPVNFLIDDKTNKIDIKTKLFLDKMKKYRTRKSLTLLKRVKRNKLSIPPLTEFKLTQYGTQNPMFNFAGNDSQASKMIIPKFIDCAIIDKAKPGATVLAVHPTLKHNKENLILMAIQKYGRGRSAILATDLLWQWRLTLDSKNFSYDNFWQSFVGWLGVRQGSIPSWMLVSSIYSAKRKDKIKFYLPNNYKYSFNEITFCVNSDNKKESIVLYPTKEEDIYITDFKPQPNKNYTLHAKFDNDIIASSCINGFSSTTTQELKILKPDLDNIQNLATSSRGVIVNINSKFNWGKWLPNTVETIGRVQEITLWHKIWIFLAILLLYITELIIRRKLKLV